MIFHMRPFATALAMVLAGARLAAQTLPELPPSQLQALTAQEASRAGQALAYLRAHAASLGLTPADDFILLHSLTNPQGECVARFWQTNQGMRVLGAAVIVRVEPDGTIVLTGNNLQQGIPAASATPNLTADAAFRIFQAKLSPTDGFAQDPVAEPILFPAQLMGGLVLARNAATGLLGLDPLHSAEAYEPAAPVLQAYQFTCQLSTPGGGPTQTLIAVVDADTGAILSRQTPDMGKADPFLYAKGNAWTPLGSQQGPASLPSVHLKLAAPRQARAAAAPRDTTTGTTTFTAMVAGTPSTVLTPVLGHGYGEYSGLVTIPTTFDPVLKGYGLLDTTRGAGANNLVFDNMGYFDAYGVYQPNTLRPSGNMVLSDHSRIYIPYTMDGVAGSLAADPAISSSLVPGLPATTGKQVQDDLWGNYTDYVPTNDPANADGVYALPGQTSAVEAMNSMTCTYEYLKSAFNRVGIDGRDTAMSVVVGDANFAGTVGHVTFDYWRANPVSGAPLPMLTVLAGEGVPGAGVLSAAEPTLLGQAFGDMLFEWIVGSNLHDSVHEGKAVQRGFSNLMAQTFMTLGALQGPQPTAMAPTWAWGYNYSTAGQCRGYLYRPSLDGISPDAWYDGITFLGAGTPNYCEGPMDRALYFLAAHASSSASSNSYSEFLPGGMQGIGLEKTSKILYKALTERVTTGEISMHDMRAACIQAAADLYGAGGAEVIATTNAFAAVNVGAAYGQTEPVKIWFDNMTYPDLSADGVLGPNKNLRNRLYPIVPMDEPTQLTVNVSGAQDTSVTWTANPAPANASGYYDLSTPFNGQITPEGVFKSSLQGASGSISVAGVQARSKADPRQWAQGLVMALTFDNDGDGNNDALDLGMIALAYGLDYSLVYQVNPHIMYGFPGITEEELQMNVAAFKSAFCH